MNKSKKASFKTYRGQGRQLSLYYNMKIDINVSVDTEKDQEIGRELIELLIALKERIEQVNEEDS